MYKEITEDDFINEMQNSSFTVYALRKIFEFLEETGNIELDTVAICGEFSEMEIEEFERDYEPCTVTILDIYAGYIVFCE